MLASLPLAAAASSQPAPSAGLPGRVIIGDARNSTLVEVDGVRLGRRGVTFPFPWALTEGQHAWLEVTLPSGKLLRPLVAILGQGPQGVSARMVHLFPEQQRALECHLASPSGY